MIDTPNKYPLKICRYFGNKKKFAIGLLVYPGNNNPKWNYLFGACLISHQLKKNIWFRENCDIIILTPEIENDIVKSLIKKIFDVHVIYTLSLNTNFPFKTNPRWYGVFNKLYFWNKKIFNYERLLILDTDLFILKSDEYIDLLIKAKGPVAGCYENNFRNSNKDLDLSDINTIIHEKYTSYIWANNKTCYNMVNAGVLSIQPNDKLYPVMLNDLEEGWNKLGFKYPSLKGKKDDFFYPEQEYLTGFFSGQWRSIPFKYLSCQTTSCHYNNNGPKYWNRFPSAYGNYSSVVIESDAFLQKYSECQIIFKNIIENINNAYNLIEPINSKSYLHQPLTKVIVQNIDPNKFNNNKNDSKKITDVVQILSANIDKTKNTILNKTNNDTLLKIKAPEKDFIGITTFNEKNNVITQENKKNANILNTNNILSPSKFNIKKNKTDSIYTDDPEQILKELNSGYLKTNFTTSMRRT